jgi:hypothetical protein
MKSSARLTILKFVLVVVIGLLLLNAVSKLFNGFASILDAIHVVLAVPTLAMLLGKEGRAWRVLGGVYGAFLVGNGVFIVILAAMIGFWVHGLVGVPIMLAGLLVFLYLKLTSEAPAPLAV